MPLGKLTLTVHRYLRGETGAAAVEAAIWLIVLVPSMLSAFDLALYGFQNVQLANAAQMAAQSAFISCGQSSAAPISTNCSTFSSAVNSGAYSTSLGSTGVNVSTADGCIDGTTNLFKSSGCAATDAPYLQVILTYTYRPLFTGVFVTRILGTTMTQTTLIRMK